MRLIAISIVTLCVWSCGSGYHLRRAAHHIARAKEKGAQVDKDTIYVTDTIRIKEFSSDTVFTNVTFTDTLVQTTDRTITKVKINYKDRTVYVKTYVKSDTVIRFLRIPCEQIKVPPPWWKNISLKWNHYLALTGIFLLLFIIWLGFRKK
jgi:hypothetical protein